MILSVVVLTQCLLTLNFRLHPELHLTLPCLPGLLVSQMKLSRVSLEMIERPDSSY